MTFAYKNRTPSLYLDQGVLKTKGSSVIFETKEGILDIPIVRMASIMLGPGSTATHSAIRLCADAGAIVQWVGEHGTKAYAIADPLTGDPGRLDRQISVASDEKMCAKAVAYMFNRRFGQTLEKGLSENTVRGMEGARIKSVYQKLAAEYGVIWTARRTGRDDTWDKTDGINQAISIANGHLTNAATVSVLAAGFSPAIGFLHKGFNRAYSCDIADLYKFDVSVPIAFKIYAEKSFDNHQKIRHAVRDAIAKQNLLDKMIEDAIGVVDAGFSR